MSKDEDILLLSDATRTINANNLCQYEHEKYVK